jgi:hypothetical protein
MFVSQVTFSTVVKRHTHPTLGFCLSQLLQPPILSCPRRWMSDRSWSMPHTTSSICKEISPRRQVFRHSSGLAPQHLRSSASDEVEDVSNSSISERSNG